MAVSISISIDQNSQSIANNTSNVTVKVTAKWTGGSYNSVVDANGTPQASGWLKIDGTKYTFTSTFNTSRTTSGSQTIFTKTVNVSHANDGTKQLACSASYTTGVSSGTVTASATKALTTIPRKSSLTVSNGTLGTSQTLTVTKQASTFTHTITYKCGTASGTICTKSSSTSISWTPPLTLAKQNTSGVSVTVTLTITTYNDDTSVGSSTKTITCSIPATVKPTVSISLSDALGYADTYGGYIKNQSKLKIDVTASGSQGSTITAYKTIFNDKTYTKSSVTSGVISSSGTLTVNTTVTDSRGRTATTSSNIKVLAYNIPSISSLTVNRCDADGNATSSGEYLQVKFKATVKSLNEKNTADYTLKYKKTTDSVYTETVLTDYTNQYSVSSGTYSFAADTSSSYDITLTVTDAFNSTSRMTTGSSMKKLWSAFARGSGFAFGKVAEQADLFDVDWASIFRKDVCIGNKEGFNDGKDGIYLDAEGFLQLQRSSAQGYHPYVGFYLDDATTANGIVRLNCTSKFMEFLNASGYKFGHNIMIGNKTGYQDGNTGVYLNRAGYMHLQRSSSDGNPHIGFYLDDATAANGYIILNANTKYMQFTNANRYTFDNVLWITEGIYTTKGLRLGAADTSTVSTRAISLYWKDLSSHNIVERMSDGLTAAFGWVGSSDYKTVTRIRGQTCQYQNSTGTTALSDERMKKDFTDLSRWEKFFDSIEPYAFKMKTGTSGRFHLGFKAQQIEQALTDTGLTTQDFGGFVKLQHTVDEDDPDGNAVYEAAGIKPGDDEYGLIYTEFVALNTYKIQKLQNEVNELKKEVNELKQLVQQLVNAKGE